MNKLNKYIVTVTETLQREIIVEANNEEEAREIIKSKYEEYNIILDSEDFCSVSLDVRKDY